MRQRSSIRRHTNKRQSAGFTLIEVTLALIIFAMMTILFAAVFPMTVRGAQYSGNYTPKYFLASAVFIGSCLITCANFVNSFSESFDASTVNAFILASASVSVLASMDISKKYFFIVSGCLYV